jgi:type VI secretion system secreted protein VgrG
MEECVQLFRALGQHASAQQGLASDPQPQQDLKAAAQRWEQDGGAMVGITAPAGISFASSQAIVSYAATNVDTVARKHVQLCAGAHVNVTAAQGIGLFAQKDGLRAIAHRGKLLMQSQHDDMEIDSGKDLRISAHGRLVIMAEEIALINTAGAYIRLRGDAPEIGGPGAMNIKTNGHHWNGPASEKAQLPAFGEGEFSRAVRPVRPTDGEPVGGMEVRIEREGGEAISGTTGSDGVSPRVDAKWLEQFKAVFLRKQP